MKHPGIDREELRDGIRALGKEYIVYMRDDAIGLLPTTRLHQLASMCSDSGRSLALDAEPKSKGLLDVWDEGEPEIVFFADEGGSWQVGGRFGGEKVLPASFQILSSTSEPHAFAHGVLDWISRHQEFRRAEWIDAALGIASPNHRASLQFQAKV